MLRSGPGLGMLAMTLLVGCGGSTSPTQTAEGAAETLWEPPPLPTDGAIEALGITPPDGKPWKKMTYDEKEWYMIGKVHPIMRQVFQTFDAKKYEGLGMECLQCHGPDAKERKYKMPATHLSPVPPFDSEDFKQMYPSRIVQFMAKRVTPVMAKLINAPEFNPQTGEGFSCYGCHPKGP